MSNPEDREIRAILADLQGEIRRHRAALGITDAVATGGSPDPLVRVRERQAVNPHLPIGWPVMPRGIVARLTAYAQKLTRRLLRWYINPIVAQQNDFNAAVTELLAGLQARLEEVATRLEDTHQEPIATVRNVEAVEADLSAFRRLHEEHQETVALRLQRLENWHRTGNAAPRPAIERSAGKDTIDYFLLGARYRNPVQMAPRLGDYDDLFSDLAQAEPESEKPAPAVLDIGCGRGEFVAHLVGLGLRAYGIDLDAEAVAVGRENGHDLREEDANRHLDSLADGSLQAVTMIQVAEHLEPETLVGLLRVVARKLVPGGFVLLETLNPACLQALANWYLMDPSHRTPVHAETLRFLMSQAGFQGIEIRYLHPVPEEERLQRLPEAGAGTSIEALTEALQRDIEQLNHFLYGPQDYAAIGYKPEE